MLWWRDWVPVTKPLGWRHHLHPQVSPVLPWTPQEGLRPGVGTQAPGTTWGHQHGLRNRSLTALQAPGWGAQVGPDRRCLPVTRCPSSHPPSGRPLRLPAARVQRCYSDEEAAGLLLQLPSGGAPWQGGCGWGWRAVTPASGVAACTRRPRSVRMPVCGTRPSLAPWVPTMSPWPALGWILARGGVETGTVWGGGGCSRPQSSIVKGQ